ncbi:MAG: hypothetical protein WA970_00035 [Gammaproteobacteria bacterium]
MDAETGSYNITGSSATLTVLSYPQRLVRVADDLICGREFGIAVVVLHMAAEIAVEGCLSEAFTTRDIRGLEGPISNFLNGYNLANDHIRKLFVAMTDDKIEKQSFWQGFKESAKLRNEIMHKKKIATEEEARHSLDAVSELLRHLGHQV